MATLRTVSLLALLIGLAACGVLPYTGPPDPNNWEVAEHGHPTGH